MALVPVGLTLGIVIAFLLGEDDSVFLLGLAPALVSLAAPVAAVVLAARAAQAGQRSAKAAVVVSGLLLVAALAALPTLIYTFEGFVLVIGALILAVLVLALGVAVVKSRRRHTV
jgi:uncharacterized membrane protein